MTENKKIFLTTTLPYVNSTPHMGHAFEFILGDVIARKLRNDNEVIFNIGLDEHGLKVWEKAQELGISPEEHIENMTEKWVEFCEKFNISFDNFYKTSSPSHHTDVKTVWYRMAYKGLIYKQPYKGLYCKGCEAVKTSKDLVNGKCHDHNAEGFLIEIEEENWFFALSDFKNVIKEYIIGNPNFLTPVSKRDELLNLLEDTEDISISRLKENCPWGIEVPGDSKQNIYVWFDALLNYIFAAGFFTPNFVWDNVIQICGPDNLRFQGIMFQGFLAALGVPFTGKLLVHGTILDNDGKKMSKSLGNTVDPIDQLNKFGVDAVRYYATACISNYQNAAWREEDLINRFNADVCDSYGNLVARVTHLMEKNYPENGFSSQYWYKDDLEFGKELDRLHAEYEELWKTYDINGAFNKLNQIVKFGNAFIGDKKPWLYKTEAEIWPILTCVSYLLHLVTEEYSVLFPEKCDEIKTALIKHKKIVPFAKLAK